MGGRSMGKEREREQSRQEEPSSPLDVQNARHPAQRSAGKQPWRDFFQPQPRTCSLPVGTQVRRRMSRRVREARPCNTAAAAAAAAVSATSMHIVGKHTRDGKPTLTSSRGAATAYHGQHLLK